MAPFRIVIDGTEYPADEWGCIEDGQSLERKWDGFEGGIGESRVRTRDRCLFAHYFDLTSPPFVRLGLPVTLITGDTVGISSALPMFPIQGVQPDGTPVVYILNGGRSIKINRTTNAVIENIFTAGAQYGRPALFEGSWRVPRGETIDAFTLTINNGAGVDLYTGMTGIKARHFSVIQEEGVAKLARAFDTNKIDLSSDAITFLADFEAGDSSFGISDLLESQGELLVIKPDGPRKFDPRGNNLPLQKFVGANPSTSPITGSNSHGHGPYAYWMHPSGNWRILGKEMIPIGVESDSQFYIDNTVDFNLASEWKSFVAYGRWGYGTRGGQLFQMFLGEDGIGPWYGGMLDISAQVSGLRVVMDDGPSLWIIGSNVPILTSILRIDLQKDGSVRTPVGTVRGATIGGSSQTARFSLGFDDFGTERLKQLRRMWMVTQGMGGIDSYTLSYFRDGSAAATAIGTITTDGFHERTPGVALDEFREARFAVSAFPSGTTDMRWRYMGVEVRTSDIYRARIPLTLSSVKGFGSIPTLLSNLRLLKNAQEIQVKAPEVNETRTAHILSVREKAVPSEGGEGIGYEVDVLIEAFTV